MSRSPGLPSVSRALLCLLLATVLAGGDVWALGPLEKNHPLVEQGERAYAEGRYDDALRAFDDAKRELPGQAALDFNRGNALHKLKRYDEAKDAFLRAQATTDAQLRQKGFYNLGNTYAEMGDRAEAIRAYRRALTLNPNDEDARHNLEVVLRNLPPPPPKQDGGTDGGSDGGSDGGQDGGGSDGGGADGGPPSDGGAGFGPSGAHADGGAGSRGSQGASDGGNPDQDKNQEREPELKDAGAPTLDGGQPKPPSRDGGVQPLGRLPDGGMPAAMPLEETERLLDVLKQGEKNLQMWKFQQKRPRKANEKDW